MEEGGFVMCCVLTNAQINVEPEGAKKDDFPFVAMGHGGGLATNAGGRELSAVPF